MSTPAPLPPSPLPPVPRTADAFSFWSTDKIRFGDVDAVGHANSLAIGGIFEASRVELLRDIGISQTDATVKCSLAKLTFEYLDELNMFESVRVGESVARIGNSSFILHSALFVRREDTELCVATCEAVCVLIDTASRRPTAIPALPRTKLGSYARR